MRIGLDDDEEDGAHNSAFKYQQFKGYIGLMMMKQSTPIFFSNFFYCFMILLNLFDPTCKDPNLLFSLKGFHWMSSVKTNLFFVELSLSVFQKNSIVKSIAILFLVLYCRNLH